MKRYKFEVRNRKGLEFETEASLNTLNEAKLYASGMTLMHKTRKVHIYELTETGWDFILTIG